MGKEEMKTNETYINVEILHLLLVRINAKAPMEMPVDVLGEQFVCQCHELCVVSVNHDLTHTTCNRRRIKRYRQYFLNRMRTIRVS